MDISSKMERSVVPWMTSMLASPVFDGQFVGKVRFSSNTVTDRTVFEPVLGHLGPDRGRSDDDHSRFLREVGDFMPEGDEGWVETVKTDDGHSRAIAHFQNRFIVWNKARPNRL